MLYKKKQANKLKLCRSARRVGKKNPLLQMGNTSRGGGWRDVLQGPALLFASPHGVVQAKGDKIQPHASCPNLGGRQAEIAPHPEPLEPSPGPNNRHHPSRNSRTLGCACRSRMIATISQENTIPGDADLTLGITGSTAPSDALVAGTGPSYPLLIPCERGWQTLAQLGRQTPSLPPHPNPSAAPGIQGQRKSRKRKDAGREIAVLFLPSVLHVSCRASCVGWKMPRAPATPGVA